jgi:ssDNA-binding Zn-finger/Zn-ribbon topoisomerase 1
MVICPECGADIDPKKQSVEAHGIFHWGVPFKDLYKIDNPEARKRYQKLMGKKAGGDD